MSSATVDSLLEVPFCDRELQNKIKIVIEGKPKPELNLFGVTSVDENGVMKVQHFEPAMYDTVPWLTGSEQLLTFFCWPCLLFLPKQDLWKVDDFASLTDSIAAHEKCAKHIQAKLLLKTFENEHADRRPQMDILQRRYMVRKNRDILKMLMDVVIHVIIKTRPPNIRCQSQVQINPETCIKVLKFLRSTTSQAADCTDEVIKLIETYPELLNDLVDSITRTMVSYFKKEVQSARYVSLIVSDHSTDLTNFQFSIILRFIKNGKVCERFVGFYTVVGNKTPEIIFNLLLHIFDEYSIAEKFLSFSCDGAVFADTAELSEVNRMLEKNHPNYYFVPCHFHGLYSVLEQSLSGSKELAIFFKVLNTMEVFLEKGSRQRKTLEIIILSTEVKLRSSKTWFESTPFLTLLSNYRKHFIELFDSMTQNCNKWSANDIVNACGFSHFLKDIKNVFLIRVLTTLFHNALPLDTAFRSSEPERIFGTDTVSTILKKNFALRQEFGPFWVASLHECNSDKDEQSTKRLKTDKSSLIDSLNKLYTNIVDRISQEIIIRYNNLVKLEFCCLLHKEHRVPDPTVEPGSKTPEYYLNLIRELQPNFNSDQLKTELDILRFNAALFQKHNLYDMLHFISDSNFTNVFKQIDELAEFTLTMPFKPATSIETYSKFEKIKKFNYCLKRGMAPSFDIGMLNVESEFLEELKRDDFLCDEVIARFYEENKTLELLRDCLALCSSS